MSFIVTVVCMALAWIVVFESYRDGYLAITARLDASWAAYHSISSWLAADQQLLEEQYDLIENTEAAIFNILKRSRILRQRESLLAACLVRQEELFAKSRSVLWVVYEGLFI